MIRRKKVIILKRNSVLEIRLGKSFKKLKANEESYSPPSTQTIKAERNSNQGFIMRSFQSSGRKKSTHSFGFGVYAKSATIQELTDPNDAKPILEFSKIMTADQSYDPEIEAVYGRV